MKLTISVSKDTIDHNVHFLTKVLNGQSGIKATHISQTGFSNRTIDIETTTEITPQEAIDLGLVCGKILAGEY